MGDIIIFADNVQVNAKLDTRIFRPFIIDDLFADVDPDCQTVTCENLLGDLITTGGKYKEAFLAYYECAGCREIAGTRYIPRLPDGLAPTLGAGFGVRGDLPGKPPPVKGVSFEALASGNIYIFAHTIQFAERAKWPQLVVEGLAGGSVGPANPQYAWSPVGEVIA